MMITNTQTYDEEFFRRFSQATTSTNNNNNNDDDNAIPNPNQMKSRSFATAFEACQSTIFEEESSKKSTTPELFTMKRNNNNETSHQTNGNLIRVIGFVQELDTETSLLDVNPRKFVSNIVAPAAAETENESENQNSPLYVECSSAFITPIPGFSYLQENQNQNQQEESNTTDTTTSTTNRNAKSRQILPSSPIQKRGRMERENNNNEEVDLSSANDDMKTATKKQKRNRAEEEDDDSPLEEPQTCPHDGKKQQQQKKRNKNKITSLAYGDEDSIRKTEKDNIADRSMWKDVLGLSVSPTHETLATGVVGLIPNVQQQQLPQLFNLVELTGFLVNPQQQEQEQGQQESNHVINIGVGGDNDFDDDGNLMMASRFHNMPDAICPRLLVVGWRILDSVEEAHNETKRQQQQQQEKSKSENQRKEEIAVEKEEEQFYKSLQELIESQVFAEHASFSMSASKLLLLHLVSSVTIRNESGAFGDLAIGLDFVVSSDEKDGQENNNNNHDESNNNTNQQREHIAFQNFTAKLTTIIHALRPCSIACNVDYQFDLAQAAANTLRNNNHKNITNNKLSLTHPSSVVARLDYEQQAVSSCLFSLPQGAEMILVVDDVENRFGGASTNDDSSSTMMQKKRKVETSVFAPSSAGASTNASSVVSKEYQQQQKAISSYSRNVSVISDLIINQKLPLLFGPGCEVSFERDIGLLFLVRVRQQEKNNNNQKSQQQNDDKNNKPLGEDAAASATIAKLKQLAGQCDEEQLAETCFGTDMFLPLRCKVTFNDGTTSKDDQTQTQQNELERLQNLIIEGTFDKYLARARSLYKSCSPNTTTTSSNNNGSSSSSYFADNENNEGDEYFMRTINDLRNMPPHPRTGKVVWWSTSMIKHSAANVLLTMARARACLGGRRLVTKSDIDEVNSLLIELRTK